MQVIYIDTLICVNLFTDYIILVTIKRILHINARNRRVILGAMFAGVSTVAVFLPFYSAWFSIIYKSVTATVTILISFGYQSINKFIVRSLTFIGVSMLLCACVITVELLWDPEGAFVYNDVLYFDISPTLLIITTVIVFFILNIYNKASEKHKLSCAVRTVTIYMNNENKITFESAVDTGCNLREPFSGLPVIILEYEILTGNKIPSEKKRLIPFSTASGSDIIIGFKPDKVFIDGKEIHKGCYIGICKEKLRGEIKSIMGAELSEAVI